MTPTPYESGEPGEHPLEDPHVLEIFKQEVYGQCGFALEAAADMQRQLTGRLPDGAERLFASLQALLLAVANISKLLWGTSPTTSEARRPLRSALQVNDDSPLRNRDLRNHFEHFDERLEEWVERDPRRNFVDMNVGPPGMLGGIDPAQSFLRHFDPSRWVASFWDEEYELLPVLDAAAELRERAKPEWLRGVEEARAQADALRAAHERREDER